MMRDLWRRLFGSASRSSPADARTEETLLAEESGQGMADASRTGTEEPTTSRRWTDVDDVRLESRARALSDRGQTVEAVALLANEGIFFAGHVSGAGLPCLCRRCLLPAVVSAQSGGVSFIRDFVVARRRVLFYWAPSDLGSDAEKLRYSMRNSLRVRLNELRLQRWHKRAHPTRINPFTGQPLP